VGVQLVVGADFASIFVHFDHAEEAEAAGYKNMSSPPAA
jgi:hypothetical protein